MFDFGSSASLSRCGRLLCLLVVCYWLPGQDCSFVNSHGDYGSRLATRIPLFHRSIPNNSTLSSSTKFTNYLSTLPSTRQPSIVTSSYRKSRELEESDDIQSSTTMIITSCLVALIILLIIVGAIFMLKIFRKRRNANKVASSILERDQQQQNRVDYNNLTQSSNSISRSEPEVDCCYENLEAEPSAPDLETIVSPVYATEEYLPRCSIIVEDYANTFHSVEFLDCDQPPAYTDLNFNE